MVAARVGKLSLLVLLQPSTSSFAAVLQTGPPQKRLAWLYRLWAPA